MVGFSPSYFALHDCRLFSVAAWTNVLAYSFNIVASQTPSVCVCVYIRTRVACTILGRSCSTITACNTGQCQSGAMRLLSNGDRARIQVNEMRGVVLYHVNVLLKDQYSTLACNSHTASLTRHGRSVGCSIGWLIITAAEIWSDRLDGLRTVFRLRELAPNKTGECLLPTGPVRVCV